MKDTVALEHSLSSLGRLLVPALLTAALAAALFSQAARGQEEYSGSIDQVVVSEDGERGTAFVSVSDRSDQPVPGLTEFDASVDGKGVDVTQVTQGVDNTQPVAIVLAMDVSGSMAEGGALDRTKEAAQRFLQGLRPEDSVAVLAFADEVAIVQPFTTDKQAVGSAIEGLSAGGTTSLYQGTVESVELATSSETPRRAVVLLSDGGLGILVGSASENDALSASESGGVPIFSIGLGPEIDRDYLGQLADISGGRFAETPSPEGLDTLYQEVSQLLRGQYAIEFELPASDSRERELSISFEIQDNLYTASARFQADPLLAAGSSGGGGISPAVVGIVLIFVLLVLGAATALILRRRRRRLEPARIDVEAGAGEDAEPVPQHELVEITTEGTGKLVVIAGPNTGASVIISANPIDVGSDPACALRLDASNGAVAGTHARVWLQHDRLMLHHIARRQQTLVGQKPVQWATLEPNDSIQIGPHVLSFSLEA